MSSFTCNMKSRAVAWPRASLWQSKPPLVVATSSPRSCWSFLQPLAAAITLGAEVLGGQVGALATEMGEAVVATVEVGDEISRLTKAGLCWRFRPGTPRQPQQGGQPLQRRSGPHSLALRRSRGPPTWERPHLHRHWHHLPRLGHCGVDADVDRAVAMLVVNPSTAEAPPRWYHSHHPQHHQLRHLRQVMTRVPREDPQQTQRQGQHRHQLPRPGMLARQASC
mmetsp:Transcript_120266/g.221207  ORF Transcript_120266/g.221207 Transcript_120266/m.221207 type:complete len:223 (+) Transcript_120266:94-762(+)